MILIQSEARGVRDPERLKREQKRKENREKEALKQGPSDGGLKVIRISFIKWAAKVNIHLLVKSSATLCLNFLELIGHVVWHFNSSLSGQQFLCTSYFCFGSIFIHPFLSLIHVFVNNIQWECVMVITARLWTTSSVPAYILLFSDILTSLMHQLPCPLINCLTCHRK